MNTLETFRTKEVYGMNVIIDRDECISCGVCESMCPEVFRMADDGLSEVHQQPTPDLEAATREAAESCPVSIIHVEED